MKSVSTPPRKAGPAFFADAIVLDTATSTFFVALVRMCGPRNAWSLSTPIPHLPFSFAAVSEPRPHCPAAAKTTSDFAAIWLSASYLHLSWATNSCE